MKYDSEHQKQTFTKENHYLKVFGHKSFHIANAIWHANDLQFPSPTSTLHGSI